MKSGVSLSASQCRLHTVNYAKNYLRLISNLALLQTFLARVNCSQCVKTFSEFSLDFPSDHGSLFFLLLLSASLKWAVICEKRFKLPGSYERIMVLGSSFKKMRKQRCTLPPSFLLPPAGLFYGPISYTLPLFRPLYN